MEDGFLFKWLDFGQLEALRLWTAQAAEETDDSSWNEFWKRLNCLTVIERHRRDTEIEMLAKSN